MLFIGVLLFLTFAAGIAGAESRVAVTAAYQIPHIAGESRPEGNPEVMAAKKEHSGLGSTVSLYIRNGTGKALSLEDISWEGESVSRHAGPPDYRAIWWRMLPDSLSPGKEGEIAICLRKGFEKPVDLDLKFSSGTRMSHRLPPDPPPFRIETISFSEDLKKAYLYIEGSGKDTEIPRIIILDGKPLRKEVRWLSSGYVGGLRVAVVTPKEGFERGRHYTFRASSGKASVGATIRAFSGLSRFGTYGFANFERYAASGLDAFNSFGKVSREGLDSAARSGVKVAMIVGQGALPEETKGHPALYAYLAMDEPDVHDYSSDESRPMHLRVGASALPLARWSAACAKADPLTPTMTTLDLTFTPQNYFIYGPLADILNPDCYPVTIGWPIKAVREKARTSKQAAAPRPFTFTYQGCWEEWAIPQDHWIGPDEVRKAGWGKYVDTARLRGFGRAPVPSEIRMQMLYALGCGARGLFSYTDATEAGGSLIFHSSSDLPEIWQEIGRTSRALRLVAPLIEISHPADWAKAGRPTLWLSALIAGDRGALVAVVNEDCISNKEGFTQKAARDARFSFPDLPWLKGKTVMRVEEGVLSPLEARRDKGCISWTEPILTDAALYLILADEDMAKQLEGRARTEAPVATGEGKKKGEESYLHGRRFTGSPSKGLSD